MRVILLLPLFAALLFAGCARPADAGAMIPNFASVGRTQAKSVKVEVTGGRETSPMWKSEVSSHDFQEALQSSLLKFRVFSHVVTSGSTDYRLEADLLDLQQPMMGFNMTVTDHVRWRLTNLHSGKVVWEETIAPSYTATVGDAFVGVNRLALANEGAVRQNIKSGIEKIALLSL